MGALNSAFFLCYVLSFKKERSNQKTYFDKVDKSAQKSRGRPILDPIDHFRVPWRPFWNFEFLIEGVIESKTYCAKLTLVAKN